MNVYILEILVFIQILFDVNLNFIEQFKGCHKHGRMLCFPRDVENKAGSNSRYSNL